jgi:hypothetical protein
MSEVKPPPQKFGHQCLGCHQRIKPLTVRIPVKVRPKVPQGDGKSYSHESLKLVGFRHAGCSLAKTT